MAGNWDLEVAAEELRRAAPEAWTRFLRAVSDEFGASMERMLGAPNAEAMMRSAGEARAMRELAHRLVNARVTAEKLKEKG